MDRRRFLKLLTGAVGIGLHVGIPRIALTPIVSTVRNLDADGDFASSLIGILVNSRLSRFEISSCDWKRLDQH